MPRIASLHITNHNGPTSEITETHDPIFSIIKSRIFPLDHSPFKNLPRFRKIDISLDKGFLAFSRIIRQLIHILYLQKFKLPFKSSIRPPNPTNTRTQI